MQGWHYFVGQLLNLIVDKFWGVGVKTAVTADPSFRPRHLSELEKPSEEESEHLQEVQLSLYDKPQMTMTWMAENLQRHTLY